MENFHVKFLKGQQQISYFFQYCIITKNTSWWQHWKYKLVKLIKRSIFWVVLCTGILCKNVYIIFGAFLYKIYKKENHWNIWALHNTKTSFCKLASIKFLKNKFSYSKENTVDAIHSHFSLQNHVNTTIVVYKKDSYQTY